MVPKDNAGNQATVQRTDPAKDIKLFRFWTHPAQILGHLAALIQFHKEHDCFEAANGFVARRNCQIYKANMEALPALGASPPLIDSALVCFMQAICSFLQRTYMILGSS